MGRPHPLTLALDTSGLFERFCLIRIAALSRGLAILSRLILQGGADPAPPGRRKKSHPSLVDALESGWVMKFRSPS